MAKKGGHSGHGKNQSPPKDRPGGHTHRLPQQGPLTPKNAPQQAENLDLNPHKFTRPPLSPTPQLGHRSKKK